MLLSRKTCKKPEPSGRTAPKGYSGDGFLPAAADPVVGNGQQHEGTDPGQRRGKVDAPPADPDGQHRHLFKRFLCYAYRHFPAGRQIVIWRAVPADNGAPGVYVLRDSWAAPGNDFAQEK